MNAIGRSVAAELLRVLSTRIWWILALVLFGYTAFVAGFLALFLGDLGKVLGGGTDLPARAVADLVYATATSVGYVVPVLLGALIVTSEYRTGTLTPTLLAEPRRGVVLTGKAIAAAAFGALFGVVGLLGSVGLGGVVLAVSGGDPLLGSAETWVLCLRALLAMALWGLIGVGLGALVANQVVAIVVILVFTQFIEPILRVVGAIWAWSAEVGKFLPGAASDALVGSGLFGSLGALDPEAAAMHSAALSWWEGGLVLAGIAALLLVVARTTTWRRDVA